MTSLKRRLADVVELAVGARIVPPHRIGPLYEEEHIRRLIAAFDIDCIFDVGANEGQYARKLRERCQYKGYIVSYEPIPHLAADLAKAAAGDGRWIIKNQALDETVRDVVFHVMGDTQFSSLQVANDYGQQAFGDAIRVRDEIRLRTTTLEREFETLSKMLGFQRPYLKMDTQGCDLQVARGAGARLADFLAVQTEASIRKLYEDIPDMQETIRFFSEAGFDLSAIVPNNDGHFPLLLETDCIFLNRALAQIA